MTPDMRAKLKSLLIKHEGYREKLYQDTVGCWTIGIGRNLSANGVYPSEIDLMVNHDIDWAYHELVNTYGWFMRLNDARQIALTDMVFNLGFKKFQKFDHMIIALAQDDYKAAAKHMLDSKWALQVGKRAEELSEIMRTGEIYS